MIRMVHFATCRNLVPLLRLHGVDPDTQWTWVRAPAWLHKMWRIARRERQRQRNARAKQPLQSWSYPVLKLPRCIEIP